MEKQIYLDNASTTEMCKEAQNEIILRISQLNGNPSSVHGKGIEAQEYIENTREILSEFIGSQKNEIYFTPGGSYSNNMALIGAAMALKRRGNKIITTQIEHSSVLNVMKYLETQGFEVLYLKPNKDGIISLSEVFENLDKNTILVSIMFVNNETGAVQPIDRINKIMKEKSPNALFHVDCVSSFCKLQINVKKLGIDLLSASSHKVHGPTGVGLLYISSKARVLPILFGGGQERNIVPGTEPVFLISSFGKAVQTYDIDKEYRNIVKLRDYTLEKLNSLDNISINSGTNTLPHILNFSVGNIKSETLVNYLSANNIFVSGGSACAKGKQSHVLKSMGIASQNIDSAIRISFSRYNTTEDIDCLIKNLDSALKTLVTSKKHRH